MAQDQNKARTTVTLLSDDITMIDKLKPLIEKDFKISNIDVVRKALNIALRQLSPQ